MRFPATQSVVRTAVALASLLGTTQARADDASDARDELKQGYALKQTGNCHDAVTHFARSFQLDPKPKAVLNMADCEQRAGDLVSARDHATQGRDLARQKKNAELLSVATSQLATIEKRMPRLAIALAAGAPADTTVTCDGKAIEAASIGVSVPVNPGAHVVRAVAPARVERTFSFTLAEEAAQTIEVTPGEPVASPVTARAPSADDNGSGRGLFSHLGTARVVAVGLGGLGLVGVGVGIAAGLAAGSKHGALEQECPANACPPSAQGDLDGFHELRTWSAVGYIVGFAGLAGGVALWLAAPHAGSAAATAQLSFGAGTVSLVGAF